MQEINKAVAEGRKGAFRGLTGEEQERGEEGEATEIKHEGGWRAGKEEMSSLSLCLRNFCLIALMATSCPERGGRIQPLRCGGENRATR